MHRLAWHGGSVGTSALALSLQCNKALHNEVPPIGAKFHSDRNTDKRKDLWPSKFSGGLKTVAGKYCQS